jgi:hypothetical protein
MHDLASRADIAKLESKLEHLFAKQSQTLTIRLAALAHCS